MGPENLCAGAANKISTKFYKARVKFQGRPTTAVESIESTQALMVVSRYSIALVSALLLSDSLVKPNCLFLVYFRQGRHISKQLFYL